MWLPPAILLLAALTVVFTAWLNTRTVLTHLEAFRNELRAEIRAAVAELRSDIRYLARRVERIEEQRLIR